MSKIYILKVVRRTRDAISFAALHFLGFSLAAPRTDKRIGRNRLEFLAEAMTYDIKFTTVVEPHKNKALPTTRAVDVLWVPALNARIGVSLSLIFAVHALIVQE
jgi:hypothetical protein